MHVDVSLNQNARRNPKLLIGRSRLRSLPLCQTPSKTKSPLLRLSRPNRSRVPGLLRRLLLLRPCRSNGNGGPRPRLPRRGRGLGLGRGRGQNWGLS